MSDVAGTVFQLLGTALACFDRIQIARNLDTDLATHRIKLDIVQYRLSRWGEVVGVSFYNDEVQSTTLDTKQDNAVVLSHQGDEKARGILTKMVDLMENAEKGYAVLATKPEHLVPPEEHMDNPWQQLRRSIRSRLKRPKAQAMSAGHSLQWAFYKKEQFQNFITNISQILDDLEQLFSPDQAARVQELGKDLCTDLTQENLQMLKEIVQNCDRLLEAAVDQVLKPPSGNSVTFNTDKNEGSQMGYNHGNVIQSFGGTHYGTHHGTGNQNNTFSSPPRQ